MADKSTAGPGAFLRGALPFTPAGAAGLFAAAELQDCAAHVLMTMAQVAPADVASTALGEKVNQGQSPLALGRGNAFERQLTRGVPSRLGVALGHNGLGTDLFVDVTRRVPMPPSGHGREEALRRREQATLDVLADGGAATVWQGALTVTLGKVAFRVQPDLIIRDDTGRLRVGEVKSWADNGPRTSGRALSSALGQVAVGDLALRQAGHVTVPEAVLVLARPRSSDASVRVQATGREKALIDDAARAFPQVASDALRRLPPGSTLDQSDTVRALPTAYGDLCRLRCALADWCRRRAVERGDPAVLGDAAAGDLEPGALLRGPNARPPLLQAAVDAHLRATGLTTAPTQAAEGDPTRA